MGTAVSAKKEQSANLNEALEKLNEGQEDCLVQRFGDIKAVGVKAIPTGILSLDTALGCGGFPRGRISEIYGPNSSGKTTSLLCAIGEVQAAGGEAAYIDAEHRFDPAWAKALGVNVDKLVFSQPPSGEDGLNVVEELIPHVDIVVVDSVAALVPRAELEGEMDDSFMGLQARMMGKGLRKLNGVAAKNNTAVIFTNQLRMKIGVMFGNPETTPGGEALKFWASVRIDIRPKEQIKEGDLVVGRRSKVKIVKNSCAPPFQEAEFDFYFGVCPCHAKGPDRIGDLLDVAERTNVVEKSGAYFSFRGERIGQGRMNTIAYLKANPKIQSAVFAAVKEGAK
jgi:recombination protein RecA